MAGSATHPGKQKRLFIQIAVRFIPIFLLMLILVCVVLYQSTLNGYLKAQNRLMDQRLSLAVSNTFDLVDGELAPGDAWIYDYWEKHPEVLKEPITDEERAAAEACTDDSDWMDPKALEKMPDEMQRYLAKNHAQNIVFF